MSATNIEPEVGVAVRRVSWGAIFAGAVLAMALMVFFTTMGLAIGAGAVDPLYDDQPLAGLGTGAGIYLLVTQLISLAVAGYAGARLAGVPRTISSILHGAAIWSLATLVLAWAAIAGGGAIFGAASSVLSNAGRAAANVADTVIPDSISFPDFSQLASQISVDDLPPEIQEVLEENNITTDRLRAEAEEAFRNVVSQQEQDRALNILRGVLVDAVRTPGDIGSDVNDAVDELVGGPDAVFSEEDRQEVLTVLERRLGITPEEVEQVVQSMETRIDEAVEQLRQTLDQIQQDALELAQQATDALAMTAKWLAIASILGLMAAIGGALIGKPSGLLGDRLDRRLG